MIKTATIFCLFTLFIGGQLLSQDWDVVWENKPPLNIPHPNEWMQGSASYTGIAYDHTKDLVYIVNPGLCGTVPGAFYCPRIHIWDPETGDVATSSGQNGQLNVDTSIVKGGHDNGRFSLFRIDVDEAGRIFSANVVAPIWGDCIPGPPPNCNPAFLTDGPFKVYRWDNAAASPELVFESQGISPSNSELLYGVWGTSFDVVGKRHLIAGTPEDSVRIFISGGDFNGAKNDQINVLTVDRQPSPLYDYRLALQMPYNPAGTLFAGSGIAASGAFMDSPVWASNAASATLLVNQRQDPTAPLPQLQATSGLYTMPRVLTGDGGPIRFIPNTSSNLPYLVVADQLPKPGIVLQNENTSARVLTVSILGPVLWPPTETPPLGSNDFDQIAGTNNYITDVDYKIWINPVDGNKHLQLFVLMSNNGIASYRSKLPMPVPVELSAFSAQRQGSSIQLIWQVAYESNNYGFEVQRSLDNGSNWQRIGFVAGQGSSNKLKEYRFQDPADDFIHEIELVQYRLKQLDHDGTFMYSPIVEVQLAPTATGLTLMQNYPNPFNPATKLSYSIQESGFVSLKVYNVLGEEVSTLVQDFKEAGSYAVEFHAEGLPSGVYMYRIESAAGSIQKHMVLSR
jgi:type IX secretion system substrate protein